MNPLLLLSVTCCINKKLIPQLDCRVSNGILPLVNSTAVYFLFGARANEDISSAVLHFPEGIISFFLTATASSTAILTAKRA